MDTVGDDGTATFGYNEPNSISGTVWSDGNGDGSQRSGGDGLGGIPVTLYEDDGVTVVATTTTNPDGSYSFGNLPPGDYVVEVTTPPGGDQTGDPDGTTG